MDQNKQGLNLVDNPEEWHLSLKISDKAIDMVACKSGRPGTLINDRLPLPEAASNPLSVISDVVYDNSLLLSEFGRIDVLIDTPRFIITPSELCQEGLDEAIIAGLWPRESLSVISTPIAGTEEILLAGVETTIISFVRRTFPSASIAHRLSPVLSYLITKDHEPGTKGMYVNVSDKRIDVIYLGERGLRAVNTYDTPTSDDMIYYIMAVAKGCNMDINNDVLTICGDSTEAEQLQTSIRKYMPKVLLMDPPYEMTASGTETAAAPLELTLMQLCE